MSDGAKAATALLVQLLGTLGAVLVGQGIASGYRSMTGFGATFFGIALMCFLAWDRMKP